MKIFFAQDDNWIAPLIINGAVVTCKLNTGVSNLIRISDIKAQKKTVVLKDYSGQTRGQWWFGG